MTDDTKVMSVFWFVVVILGLGLIAFAFWFFPTYSVWSREKSGQAQLAEAQWSKKVQTEEALANLESEKLNAQAEVERAKGMAEAIRIEGGNLTADYIRYLWVRQQVNLNDKTVIYLPTEAGLPILEADRLNK